MGCSGKVCFEYVTHAEYEVKKVKLDHGPASSCLLAILRD